VRVITRGWYRVRATVRHVDSSAPPSATPPASVSPWIVAADAAGLLDFLAATFGAVEAGRLPRPDGSLGHAETRIGDTAVVVVDAAEGWTAVPALLRIRVDDLDAVVSRAEAAGAVVVTARTSLPFGDDVARVRDPWDNLWWLHQHVEDVDFATLLGRMEDPATLTAMQEYDASLEAEMRRRS
jgi:PhnB protein